MAQAQAQAQTAKFPPQIKYIVGNEACERFSYYGMRAILVIFMTKYLMMADNSAKETYHLFAGACYFFPLLGAWISDRFWGKYRTIMVLSIVYCLGHFVLAMWDGQTAMYWGLGLIALGAGGIKPCVSAHVGDQFNESNKSLLERTFSYFYFSINLGAFFSSLLIPVVLPKYGSGWAFGIPGILMAIATVVFWMGRKHYVHVPPTGKHGPAGFMPILSYSLRNLGKRRPGQKLLDVARTKFKAEEVEAAQAALDIFKVFFTVTIFWALFDQQGSSWVLQADKMDLNFFGMSVLPSQIQALNPILVMILVPVFSYGVYPLAEKLGFRPTPLRKMTVGMMVAAFSFVVVGMFQMQLDHGRHLSVAWQVVPYMIITCSEVLVSITGLEFAYTQAPRSMKSTIMSFWLLTVFFGDMLVAYFAKINVFHGANEFFFYAALMGGVSLIFAWNASRYKVRNYIENGENGGNGQGASRDEVLVAELEATPGLMSQTQRMSDRSQLGGEALSGPSST